MTPDLYIEEYPGGRAIVEAPTSLTAFVGRATRGRLEQPVAVGRFSEFQREFATTPSDAPLALAVRAFFRHGGRNALVVAVPEHGDS